MPQIRIEVERMKYGIIHAFSSHNQEIEAALNEGLEKAIASFPFEETIEETAREVIKDVIHSAIVGFFRYGEGGEILKQAVQKSIESLEKKYK